MKTKWTIYKELELIPKSEPEPGTKQQKTIAQLCTIAALAFEHTTHILFATRTRKSEPQIWQTLDSEGHLWWNGYDPVTGQTTYLESEEEAFIWLDQLSYRQ